MLALKCRQSFNYVAVVRAMTSVQYEFGDMRLFSAIYTRMLK